jgi:hypothetical protein
MLGIEDFAGLIGERFQIATGGERATLVLQEIAADERPATEARPAHLRPEGFRLLFELTGGALPESAIGELGHPATGTHALFFHRVGLRDTGPARYEIIFN